MIRFDGVSKSYRVKGSLRHVLRNASFRLPGDRNIAVIGRNGAGKSTLLRMISGAIRPDRGHIRCEGRVSWPMGFSGGLHPALTGRQNARFIARAYGADTDATVAFVEDFAEIGAFIDMPLETYSSGMRARLAFGISLAAEFDIYLVDEITAVGDAQFRAKCRQAFTERMGHAQVIMVSHGDGTLREYCHSALLLEDGHMRFFDDLEDGLREYRSLIAA